MIYRILDVTKDSYWEHVNDRKYYSKFNARSRKEAYSEHKVLAEHTFDF